jgi:hypothetical protein
VEREQAGINLNGQSACIITEMIILNVQLSPEVTDEIHRSVRGKKSKELKDLEENLGVNLVPIHPGSQDPQLATHFIVEVPDEKSAEELKARLLSSKGVVGAYIKPRDELP